MFQRRKRSRILLLMFILGVTTLLYELVTSWNEATSSNQSPTIQRPVPKLNREPDNTLRNSDVIHTVKTTNKFHLSRLNILLWTWISQVPQQTYIITDQFDPLLCPLLGCKHQVVAKGCGNDHSRRSLTCKLGFEFDTYMENATKWWCHWDDDNYVNLQRLLQLLKTYDHETPWYIGRKSVENGSELSLMTDPFSSDVEFAHGGSGFCISRAMAMLLKSFVHKGNIMKLSKGWIATNSNSIYKYLAAFIPRSIYRIYNDDVMIGLFITHFLGYNVTTSELFNSHWHQQSLKGLVTPNEIAKQISLSYNAVVHVTFNTDHSFSKKSDPTRFLSIHCYLYPTTDYCKIMSKSNGKF